MNFVIENCGGSKTPINIEGEKGIVLGAVAFGQSEGKTLGIEPSVGIGRVEFAHNGSDWVLIDYTESEKGRTITRKDFQVEKIKKEIEALPSAISVSRYVRESPIFSEEEKLDIIRELLFTGSSPILLTYGIELSF